MKNHSSDVSGLNFASSSTAEETLRLIATLSAPAGLEERVRTRLRGAPQKARLLHWPAPAAAAVGTAGGWMRGAAAAAIVFVVAGGGWSVYSHVQGHPAAGALAAQPHVGAGGFSSAGAMRTPQGPSTPVLVHPQAPADGLHPQAVQAVIPAGHRHRIPHKTNVVAAQP